MSLFWHVTHNRIFTDMDEHLRKSCRTYIHNLYFSVNRFSSKLRANCKHLH